MKTKIDLSIVCCYNSEEQLNNLLLKSYEKQDVECELILIDNRTGKFSSAAKALNHGAEISNCNNLVFTHQDIVFLEENTLENLYKNIINCDGIIGVARS